jgi:hypothetical protein
MSSLCVYIAAHCPVSVHSIQLAREAAAAFPDVDVRVIDVDQLELSAPTPDDVLFTPGYFLDGRPVCWGNPYRWELFQWLQEATQRAGHEEFC